MSEQADALKDRTLRFALEAIELTKSFPQTEEGRIVARQFLRCATSVGANYRAACRARSHADFTSKIGIVAEEADECSYWLNIAEGAHLISVDRMRNLHREVGELCAIFSKAVGTARRNASANRA